MGTSAFFGFPWVLRSKASYHPLSKLKLHLPGGKGMLIENRLGKVIAGT
jgi:hypothetical protein